MPIYLSTCIITTTPIWVSLIAYIYLNESLKKIDIFAMLISFLGVIIINNPFQTDEQLERDVQKTYYSAKSIFIGTCFALSGSLGGSIANICKRIMRGNIHHSVSPFYWAGGCTILSPIAHFIYFADKNARSIEPLEGSVYDARVLILLFLATLAGFTGQVLQSRAY